MKLYATVESERAQKGQGGNKFLSIVLRVGDRTFSRVVATLEARVSGDAVEVGYTPQGASETTRHTFFA